jgi:nucleoside-triphosphatase THEP1
MIVILTAPIQSGKTTSLINWSAEIKDVHGILTPVINGKRVFMNAQTKELFPMEAVGDEETLTIGRFLFSKNNFDRAIQIIRNAITHKGWLIIDEIGPLELKGEGFCNVLKEVLIARKEKTVLVVREVLVQDVKKYFNMHDVEIINDITTLKKLPG